MGPEEDLPTLISRSDHLGVLRYVRAHKLREPELVIKHGLALLGGSELTKAKRPSGGKIPVLSPFFVPSLGEAERLAALEQLCLAALDVQDHKLAELCLSEIRDSVPNDSARSRRLLALCLESAGDLDNAGKMYDDLVKENPSNAFALKRKYCLLRSQPGKEVLATEALNAYLERNVGDVAAWAEMGDLCLDLGDYRGAAYCYEEVVLGSPLDSNIHCKLGEIYSTVGGFDNLKLARKHMAQSLELNPRNLRALHGLVAVASSFLDEAANAGKSRRDAEEEDIEVAHELLKYGGEKLLKCYKGTRMAGLVETVLKETTVRNSSE